MPRGNGGIIGPTNAPASSVAEGVWTLKEQQIAKGSGDWPGSAIRKFDISPAVSSKTVWDLSVDGPLDLGTQGTWTITANYGPLTFDVKMWGAGGGGTNLYYGGSGGGGGHSYGSISVPSASVLVVRVGQGGRNNIGTASGSFNSGYARAGGGGGKPTAEITAGGGGYSGIFITSEIHTNSIMIAGGGGGAGANYGSTTPPDGGAGGGTSGQAGDSAAGGTGGGGGGTQVAGGAAGTTVTGTSAGGSALQGGEGTGGWGTNGGGGGFYGGGPGGRDYGVSGNQAAAGGGSGYINTFYVTGGVTTAGSYETPGGSADANRGGSGDGAPTDTSVVGDDGRVYIY